MSEVGRVCGAGTGCGGCRPEIAAILDGEEEVGAAPARLSLLPQLRVG